MKDNFSVLISVYFKEVPAYLGTALESIIRQSLKPSQIVLIKDGPLNHELNQVIQKYVVKEPTLFKVISLEKNVGLGKALNIGLMECTYDIVVRMDSDDICPYDRFEKQVTFLNENIEIDVVSGWVSEFNEYIENIVSIRKVPELHNEIIRFFKKRNAINHMAVAFRKNKVQNAGSYEDVPYFEDYYLWAKMVVKGTKFYNIQESIMYARVGNDMIGRRMGIPYARKEFAFFRKIRKIGFINNFEFYAIIFLRIPLRLLPKKFLASLYKFVIRS